MNDLFIQQMVNWVREERDGGREPMKWHVGCGAHRRLCFTFSREPQVFDFNEAGLFFCGYPIRVDSTMGENGIKLEVI